MLIAFIGFLSFLFVFLALWRPRAGLKVVVFFAPWSGLAVDIGLNVSVYLIFLAPLTGVVLLYLANSARARAVTSSLGLFWLVVLYAVVWSLAQIPFLPDVAVSGGILRSPEFRALSQIVMFIVTISPAFIVPVIARSFHDIVGLAKVYLASVAILAAVGWFQLMFWVTTGEDPIPIGYVNTLLTGEGLTRSGQMMFDGAWVYRMSSFGGEPKGLGVGLAVGLLLIQAAGKGVGKLALFLWIFLFVSMIATFSTMALLCWVGASLALYVTPRNLRFSFSKRSLQVSSSTVVVSMLVVSAISLVLIFAPDNRMIRLVELRTIDRVLAGEEASGFLEDFNIAVLGYLQSSPSAAVVGVGLGNIHLYADSFLPRYAVSYAGGTTFVAKSASLRWVSELGVISLLLFLLWFMGRLRRAIRKLRLLRGNEWFSDTLAKASVAIAAFWVVSGYITPQFYFIVGTVSAVLWIAQNQYANTAGGSKELGFSMQGSFV